MTDEEDKKESDPSFMVLDLNGQKLSYDDYIEYLKGKDELNKVSKEELEFVKGLFSILNSITSEKQKGFDEGESYAEVCIKRVLKNVGEYSHYAHIADYEAMKRLRVSIDNDLGLIVHFVQEIQAEVERESERS